MGFTCRQALIKQSKPKLAEPTEQSSLCLTTVLTEIYSVLLRTTLLRINQSHSISFNTVNPRISAALLFRVALLIQNY